MKKILGTVMLAMYCVKCRESQMGEALETKWINNKRIYKAPCPACGTPMYKISSTDYTTKVGWQDIDIKD